MPAVQRSGHMGFAQRAGSSGLFTGAVLIPGTHSLPPLAVLTPNCAWQVDVETNPSLVKRFKIERMPTVLMFRGGKVGACNAARCPAAPQTAAAVACLLSSQAAAVSAAKYAAITLPQLWPLLRCRCTPSLWPALLRGWQSACGTSSPRGTRAHLPCWSLLRRWAPGTSSGRCESTW